jgi:hypothetical protein
VEADLALRVAALEERVAVLGKQIAVVAAQDRIDLLWPANDPNISEVIR